MGHLLQPADHRMDVEQNEDDDGPHYSPVSPVNAPEDENDDGPHYSPVSPVNAPEDENDPEVDSEFDWSVNPPSAHQRLLDILAAALGSVERVHQLSQALISTSSVMTGLMVTESLLTTPHTVSWFDSVQAAHQLDIWRYETPAAVHHTDDDLWSFLNGPLGASIDRTDTEPTLQDLIADAMGCVAKTTYATSTLKVNVRVWSRSSPHPRPIDTLQHLPLMHQQVYWIGSEVLVARHDSDSRPISLQSIRINAFTKPVVPHWFKLANNCIGTLKQLGCRWDPHEYGFDGTFKVMRSRLMEPTRADAATVVMWVSAIMSDMPAMLDDDYGVVARVNGELIFPSVQMLEENNDSVVKLILVRSGVIGPVLEEIVWTNGLYPARDSDDDDDEVDDDEPHVERETTDDDPDWANHNPEAGRDLPHPKIRHPEHADMRDVDIAYATDPVPHTQCINFEDDDTDVHNWLDSDPDNIVVLTAPVEGSRWGITAVCYTRSRIKWYSEEGKYVKIKCITKPPPLPANPTFQQRSQHTRLLNELHHETYKDPDQWAVQIPLGESNDPHVPLRDIEYIVNAKNIRVFQVRPTTMVWPYTEGWDVARHVDRSMESGNHCTEGTSLLLHRIRGITRRSVPL